MTLTENQESVINNVLKKINSIGINSANKDEKVITLGGYAGTGKTTSVEFIVKELRKQNKNISFAFLAYTGKATSVLNKKLENIYDDERDFIGTIHSFMYHVKTNPFTGKIVSIKWKDMGITDHSAPIVDIIIIDEASMVPRKIYEDLLRYNKIILAIGDHGQLPPIGDPFNLMQNPMFKLTEIIRQIEDSPIIKLSIMARKGEFIKYGSYGDSVIKVNRKTFINEYESIIMSPSSNLLTITATNKQRTAINHRVIEALGYDKKHPQIGERIICLKNNWNEMIFNGMMGEIVGIENFNDYNYLISFQPDGENDIKILEVAKTFFLNPKKYINNDIDPRDLRNQFDYAYAITCHKAQGSEAKSVVVFGNGFGDMKNRWLYTAITRAKENLILVS